MGTITLGLSKILVGTASTVGNMPSTMTKIGMTYKDTCKIAQDAAEVTEHFEENVAAPAVRKKSKKIPKVTFSIMNPDGEMLAEYIGGEYADGEWGFNGDELTTNKAIAIETEQGLDFHIPNADIEAVINADLSAKGILLVDFTVTPLAVTSGKAFVGIDKTYDE